MKSIRFARLLLAGVVILLTLLPVGAAWANPPDQETETFHWDIPLLDCPEFPVWADETVRLRTKLFYDKDGNWTHTTYHWTINGIWYNHEHPEMWLEEKTAQYTVTIDEEGQTWVGQVQNINLPGAGPIFFGAGKFVMDNEGNFTFWAGPNDYIEGNLDALCAALSPP